MLDSEEVLTAARIAYARYARVQRINIRWENMTERTRNAWVEGIREGIFHYVSWKSGIDRD